MFERNIYLHCQIIFLLTFFQQCVLYVFVFSFFIYRNYTFCIWFDVKNKIKKFVRYNVL